MKIIVITAGLAKRIMNGIDWSPPTDGSVAQVANAIATVVEMPFRTRPLRVHVDPGQSHLEITNGVPDRARAWMFQEMSLDDLLNPSSAKPVEIYS
jgi:hypothetical protein